LLIGMKALNLFGFGAQSDGPTLVDTPLGYSIIGAEESSDVQVNATMGRVYHVAQLTNRKLDRSIHQSTNGSTCKVAHASIVIEDDNTKIPHECQPATVHVCQMLTVSQSSPEKNLKVTCKSKGSRSSLQMCRISSDDAIPAKRAIIQTVKRNHYLIDSPEETGSISKYSPLAKLEQVAVALSFQVASSHRRCRPSRNRHRSCFKWENAKKQHQARRSCFWFGRAKIHSVRRSRNSGLGDLVVGLNVPRYANFYGQKKRTFIKTFSRGQSRSWFYSKVKREDGVLEEEIERGKSSIARYFDFIFK